MPHAEEPDLRTEKAHESVWSALARVIESGQQLLADRIELGRVQMEQALETSLVKAGFLLAGVPLGLGAWCVMNAAVVLLLIGTVTLPAALLLVGVVNGAIAAALLVFGLRKRASAGAPEEQPETRAAATRPGESDATGLGLREQARRVTAP